MQIHDAQEVSPGVEAALAQAGSGEVCQQSSEFGGGQLRPRLRASVHAIWFEKRPD